MILHPASCLSCPAFKAWTGGTPGGICQVRKRGVKREHELGSPPDWCPAREGVIIIVSTPIPE